MRRNFRCILSVWAGLLALVTTQALAADWHKYQSKFGSKIQLDGTSTLHDWTVEGKIVRGDMELESNFPLDPKAKPPASAKLNAKVNVAIPVTSLLSGKKLMDDVMHEALKAKMYPDIKYELKNLAPSQNAPAGALQFDTVGTLTVAGVMQTNNMTVTFEKLSETRLKVKGVTKVKMSDFGVTPPSPTVSFGLLKTGDDVTITFEWLAARSADSAKAATK